MLILARTRGGKGLRATSQILSWDSSIVVNDIKGEFRDQTAWWRARNGGKIYTFNPEGWGDGFDPLHRDQTEDDFYDSATHLLDTGETGETRVFIDRAVTMLVQLFLASRIEKI